MRAASKTKPSPSIRGILWTDYPAFFLAILPVTVWAVVLAFFPVPALITAAAAVTAGILLALAWRVWQLRRLLLHGAEALGKISLVHIRGDRGRVEYGYSYGGKHFESGATVHRNRQTTALRAGEQVVLVLDPQNPKRAYIRSIYQ